MSDTDTDLDTFLDALALELRARGHHVLRSEVRAWLEAAWPMVREDPSPGRWASEYLQTWAAAG
jgi:hypothetical protein